MTDIQPTKMRTAEVQPDPRRGAYTAPHTQLVGLGRGSLAIHIRKGNGRSTPNGGLTPMLYDSCIICAARLLLDPVVYDLLSTSNDRWF